MDLIYFIWELIKPRSVFSAKKKLKKLLQNIDGIEGFSIYNNTVLVYVKNSQVTQMIPNEVDGFLVHAINLYSEQN